MRILIGAAGSMGDVVPYLGLGSRLREAGHEVSLASYELFGDRVRQQGLDFRALPGDPELMGASPDGQRWQEGGAGPRGVLPFMRLIAAHMAELNEAFLAAAQQDADVLLLGGMTMIGGYHIAEGLGLPSMGLGLAPGHPTGEFPPTTVALPSLGRWGNRAISTAVITAGTAALSGSIKQLRISMGLPPAGARRMFHRQDAARWPVFYGFSESVVPRPADWRPGLHVVGYWWPPHPPEWQPPAALVDFLASGPPPVYVGFGSRNPRDAERISEIVSTALRRAGARGVLQAGWAGLAADGDDVINIDEVPHDWLFPQMAAVVHHAGAGTTAAGLRAGVPTVGVPNITDQPFWASRLVALGASPGAVAMKNLTVDRLANLIRAAVQDRTYRDAAETVGQRIRAEDGASHVVNAITQLKPPA
ncbi:glycosyltransferase [Saccharopolyspora sp. K220]|uniref:glycosyltransferase n=1 Tax=Saccharopolyspora soli TaxID=2926618 RepID=UPI001F55D907|nr:glycosyltransferase [Saccharopolyspora soli]MCI2421012.1 glycosyltransferase [Saccharopolyspora soli]